MVAEPFVPLLGDEVVVLDPHSADTFDIGSRFQRNDIACQENVVALRDQDGRLRMSQ